MFGDKLGKNAQREKYDFYFVFRLANETSS